MSTIRVMVSVDREALDIIRPMLTREGMSLSSFTRKTIQDYIDAHKVKQSVLKIDELEAIR